MEEKKKMRERFISRIKNKQLKNKNKSRNPKEYDDYANVICVCKLIGRKETHF